MFQFIPPTPSAQNLGNSFRIQWIKCKAERVCEVFWHLRNMCEETVDRAEHQSTRALGTQHRGISILLDDSEADDDDAGDWATCLRCL